MTLESLDKWARKHAAETWAAMPVEPLGRIKTARGAVGSVNLTLTRAGPGTRRVGHEPTSIQPPTRHDGGRHREHEGRTTTV